MRYNKIVYQTRMHRYAQVLRRGTNIWRDVICTRLETGTGKNITIFIPDAINSILHSAKKKKKKRILGVFYFYFNTCP